MEITFKTTINRYLPAIEGSTLEAVATIYFMRGCRNFHERGSNENGNFSHRRGGGGGVQPPKNPEMTFLGKIFKFQGGGGSPDPRSLPLDPCSMRRIFSAENK